MSRCATSEKIVLRQKPVLAVKMRVAAVRVPCFLLLFLRKIKRRMTFFSQKILIIYRIFCCLFGFLDFSFKRKSNLIFPRTTLIKYFWHPPFSTKKSSRKWNPSSRRARRDNTNIHNNNNASFNSVYNNYNNKNYLNNQSQNKETKPSTSYNCQNPIPRIPRITSRPS